jgi:hypothetical protein
MLRIPGVLVLDEHLTGETPRKQRPGCRRHESPRVTLLALPVSADPLLLLDMQQTLPTEAPRMFLNGC